MTPFTPEVEAEAAFKTDFFAEIRRSSADPNVHRSGDIDAGPPGRLAMVRKWRSTVKASQKKKDGGADMMHLWKIFSRYFLEKNEFIIKCIDPKTNASTHHVPQNLKKVVRAKNFAPGNNRVHFHGTGNRLQCQVRLQKLDKAPAIGRSWVRENWFFFGNFWFKKPTQTYQENDHMSS